jgi:hypothetical protein
MRTSGPPSRLRSLMRVQAKARADQIPGVLVTTGPGTPTASRFAPAQTDREHSNGRTKLPGDMKGESDAE